MVKGRDGTDIAEFDIDVIEKIKEANKAYDFLKPYQELGNLASYFRGQILSASIILESVIEEVIVDFFDIKKNDTRRDVFIGAVLKNLDFGRKMKILEKILHSVYEKAEQDAIQGFIEEVESIKNLRNKLAHNALTDAQKLVEEGKKGIIIFEYYRDGERKVHTMTGIDLQERLYKIGSIMGTLKLVQRELQGKPFRDHIFDSYLKVNKQHRQPRRSKNNRHAAG